MRCWFTVYTSNEFFDVNLPLQAAYYLLVLILTMRMKAVWSSETAVKLYQTTRCNIREDINLYIHLSENLKSHKHITWCLIKDTEMSTPQIIKTCYSTQSWASYTILLFSQYNSLRCYHPVCSRFEDFPATNFFLHSFCLLSYRYVQPIIHLPHFITPPTLVYM